MFAVYLGSILFFIFAMITAFSIPLRYYIRKDRERERLA
jgi:hypothetical protein